MRWTLDRRGGLVVPREDGTTVLLSHQCFEELLEITDRELSPCHKLTHFHVEVAGESTRLYCHSLYPRLQLLFAFLNLDHPCVCGGGGDVGWLPTHLIRP